MNVSANEQCPNISLDLSPGLPGLRFSNAIGIFSQTFFFLVVRYFLYAVWGFDILHALY